MAFINPYLWEHFDSTHNWYAGNIRRCDVYIKGQTGRQVTIDTHSFTILNYLLGEGEPELIKRQL